MVLFTLEMNSKLMIRFMQGFLHMRASGQKGELGWNG